METKNDQRIYTIYVCAVCGSDNIECSTQDDSLCGDCGEWMNVEELRVAPVGSRVSR